MNLRKIVAGATASVVAVSTLAISASADHLYYFYEKDENGEYKVDDDGKNVQAELAPELEISGGNWLYTIYNSGDGLGGENTVTDRDFKPWDIAQITIYGEIVLSQDPANDLSSVDEYSEEYDGVFSGSMLYSANSGYYGTGTFNSPQYDENDTYFSKFNWPGYAYYGLPHEGDTFEGRPEDEGGDGTNTGWCSWTTQNFVPQFIASPYTYAFTMDIPEDMRWPAHEDESEMAGLYRVGYAAWGASIDFFSMKIDLMVLKDDDGNVLLAVDELGYEITEEEAEALIEKLPLGTGEENNGDNSGDNSEDNNGDNSDGSDESTTTTPAPSTDTSNNSSNNIMPIIIGIVAAVVVIVVIVIIVVVSKKKKG